MPALAPSASASRQLTPLGWLIGAEAVILATTPLWHPRPAVAGLGVGFAVLLAASWWLAGRAFHKLHGGWIPPARATVGEEAETRIRMGGTAPAFSLLARRPGGRELEEARLHGLAGSPLDARWSWRFPRRGLTILAAPRVRTAMPFGLVTASAILGEPAEVLVLPAAASPRRGLRLALSAWLDQGGGDGHGQEDPDRLRDWQRGDPLRAIHWRATARHGRPLVMGRIGGGGRRLRVILDPAPGDRLGFERRIACACGLLRWLAGHAVTAELRLGDGPPVSGPAAEERLALVTAGTRTVEDMLAAAPGGPSAPTIVLAANDTAKRLSVRHGLLIIADHELPARFRVARRQVRGSEEG